MSLEEDIRLLSETPLFDKKFYNEKYKDVSNREMDPIRHYAKYGFSEGRWPNAFFDPKFYRDHYLNGNKTANPLIHYITSGSTTTFKTSALFDGEFYLRIYPDVAKSGMNPLVHFLLFGIHEGRISTESKIAANNSFSSTTPNCTNIKTAVIIPVYNAHDEVLDCINSVLEHTTLGKENTLIIVNDGSPDKRIKPSLAKYKSIPGVKIYNNFKNIGYTRNVNKGIKLAGDSDVVLLNSDTIVSPHWLRNMKVAAYSSENIGTVTALSNNAGAFSVPKSGTNDLPVAHNVAMTARLIGKVASESYIEVPTGNGFCFYIKRKLINDIGIFDYDKFPRGYGEENDFCMRAVDSGWANIVDHHTYVYHVRSASFKQEKEVLIEKGIETVKREHPEYSGAIKAIGKSERFKKVREEVSAVFKASNPESQVVKPKIMYVISTRTGGTPQTNKDLMEGVSDIYDTYAMASNRYEIEVFKVVNSEYKLLETISLPDPIKYATHRSAFYDETVKAILFKYKIDLLHIRHLAWHGLGLISAAKSINIPVVNSFHDFYTICPSVNLIDNEGNLSLSGLQNDGPNPLWNDETVTSYSPETSRRWKERFQSVLSDCDAFVTTCQSAKDTLLSALPKLQVRKNDFHVISHGRDFDRFEQLALEIGNQEPIKILVPGNISLSKGKELIKAVKALDSNNEIEFHVLGNCDEDLLPYIIDHGKYQRSEFTDKVSHIGAHIAGIFSIWPETYCHTLTESWACGIPVIGVAYGAVEERINRHGGGWLVTPDAKNIFDKLIHLKNNKNEITNQVKKIIDWQNNYGKSNTIHSMAVKYLKIYQTVMSRYIAGKNEVDKKIAFVMKGFFPNVPPTAYVRLVDWKQWFEEQYSGEVEFTHWSDLFTKSLDKYSLIVIQRDAVKASFVDPLIHLLKDRNIKYIYEIDDNLLDVPEASDKERVYEKYKIHTINLLRNAMEAHVTNASLKATLSAYCDDIKIRENKTFPHRWAAQQPSAEKPLNHSSEKLNILYYGSRTHQADLDFLISALDSLEQSIKDSIQLYVIGAGDFSVKDKAFITRLTPPSSRYDLFVSWLVSHKEYFNLGVAPLVDTDFSENKSYLKAIEYRELGLKVICSNILPYSALKASLNSSDITYLENSIEVWSAAIKNELSNIQEARKV